MVSKVATFLSAAEQLKSLLHTPVFARLVAVRFKYFELTGPLSKGVPVVINSWAEEGLKVRLQGGESEGTERGLQSAWSSCIFSFMISSNTAQCRPVQMRSSQSP